MPKAATRARKLRQQRRSAAAPTAAAATGASATPAAASEPRSLPAAAEAWKRGVISRREDMPPELLKYWKARHSLFSRFAQDDGDEADGGIMLDAESWYSVTPEAIAVRIAHRFRAGLAQRDTRKGKGRAQESADEAPHVLDAFAGAGGNAIAFARAGCTVTALDIDGDKLQMLMHNAALYGADVAARITPVCGDYFEYAQRAELADSFDAVFLSPPWGGVDYLAATAASGAYDYFPLDALCAPHGCAGLVAAARRLCRAGNMALFLPRSAALDDIAALAQPAAGEGRHVDVEEAWMGHKLKALVAYMGELAQWEEEWQAGWGWE